MRAMMFLLRALVVWLIIMFVEFIHGVLRAMYLAPLVGEFQARQISVVLGSFLILTIAYLFVRWIRADTKGALLTAGLVWLALTVAFELSFGRFSLALVGKNSSGLRRSAWRIADIRADRADDFAPNCGKVTRLQEQYDNPIR